MRLALGKYWKAISRNKFLNFMIGRTIVPDLPDYKPDITVLIAAYTGKNRSRIRSEASRPKATLQKK